MSTGKNIYKIKGGKLRSFTEKLLKIYNSKKDLENPPSYLEDVKIILNAEGLLDNEKGEY